MRRGNQPFFSKKLRAKWKRGMTKKAGKIEPMIDQKKAVVAGTPMPMAMGMEPRSSIKGTKAIIIM